MKIDVTAIGRGMGRTEGSAKAIAHQLANCVGRFAALWAASQALSLAIVTGRRMPAAGLRHNHYRG